MMQFDDTPPEQTPPPGPAYQTAEPILAETVPLARTFWEVLLDPKSIRWLLGVGGGAFVIGLVIWLAVQGFFTPLRVAICMAAATIAALAAGWGLLRMTVHRMAGWALALLACLVMPLNLWYLHAHDLVTIEGHLWIAALVCSVLYAATAILLADRTFVYVMMGGITMTGLLLLADMGHLAEIRGPVLLLAVLGIAAIHVERAFVEGDGPFARRRFGMAFFWSGHALLGAGLAALLAAQLTGVVLYDAVFAPWYRLLDWTQPRELTTGAGKSFALAIVALAFYVYVYSDLVVRRVGVYLYLAVGMLFWGALIAVDLLVPDVSPEMIVLALAVVALAVQLAARAALGKTALARSAGPLAAMLGILPVILGSGLYLRATFARFHATWAYEANGLFVAAMALAAAVCHLGQSGRDLRDAARRLNAVAGVGANCVAVAALLALPQIGFHSMTLQAAPLLALLAGYVVVERFVLRRMGVREAAPSGGERRPSESLTRVAVAMVAIVQVAVLGEMIGATFGRIEFMAPTLWQSALALASAAGFFGLTAVAVRDGRLFYLASGAACVAFACVGGAMELAEMNLIAMFAVAGLAIVLGVRMVGASLRRGGSAARRVEPNELLTERGLETCLALSGHVITSLALASGTLAMLARMASGLVAWHHFAPLAGLLAVAAVLAATARSSDSRRWYLFWMIGDGVLMLVTVQLLSTLRFWQKVEVFSMVLGGGLLVAGHWGWLREREEKENEQVSVALGVGSLLVGLPPLAWTVIHRFYSAFTPWDVANEVALIVVGLALLLSGVMLRVRGTTIVGGGVLLLNLLSLALYVRVPDRLQTTGMVLAISGGALFGCGLLLSMYRDRLLALPGKVKRREGVFRILNWR
jgi:hypothetical protein